MRKPIKVIPDLNEKEKERFYKKVDRNGNLPDQSVEAYKGLERCHEWRGSILKDGYGVVMFHHTHLRVHRLAYFIKTGIQPSKIYVCHKCDNRCCCNPDHLFLGNDLDNMRDASSKNRLAIGDKSGPRLHPESLKRGINHYEAKLTEDDVREIRRVYAEGNTSQQELANKYGVNQTNIGFIVRRVKWQHVA